MHDGTRILARRGEVWHSGKVSESLLCVRDPNPALPTNTGPMRKFRVKFSTGGSRIVSGQEIAYSASAAVRNEVYPVGTRVVCEFSALLSVDASYSRDSFFSTLVKWVEVIFTQGFPQASQGL